MTATSDLRGLSLTSTEAAVVSTFICGFQYYQTVRKVIEADRKEEQLRRQRQSEQSLGHYLISSDIEIALAALSALAFTYSACNKIWRLM